MRAIGDISNCLPIEQAPGYAEDDRIMRGGFETTTMSAANKKYNAGGTIKDWLEAAGKGSGDDGESTQYTDEEKSIMDDC